MQCFCTPLHIPLLRQSRRLHRHEYDLYDAGVVELAEIIHHGVERSARVVRVLHRALVCVYELGRRPARPVRAQRLQNDVRRFNPLLHMLGHHSSDHGVQVVRQTKRSVLAVVFRDID